MTAMRSLFTHDFLLLFAGPAVWAIHFLAIYGFTGVVCARPGTPPAWLAWGVAGAGLLAVAALAACVAVKPASSLADNRLFVRWLSIGLILLAILAIAWETLSVVMIPPCPALD